MTPVIDRFLVKVNQSDNDGCWLWLSAIDKHGYGRFSVGGRPVFAHRWSYEFYIGEIPAGLVIDHLCRVRTCVNPAHLEPVTILENVLRGHWAMKTHCAQGHEYTHENTYFWLRDGHSHRTCRACNRIRSAEYRARKTIGPNASADTPAQADNGGERS